MPQGPDSGENPLSGAPEGRSEPTRSAPDRELLEANHQFPGEYIIKAFGPADDRFRESVLASASAVVDQRVSSSERVSRGGKSLCITLTLQVETVDEIVSVYERLHTLQDLKLIL